MYKVKNKVLETLFFFSKKIFLVKKIKGEEFSMLSLKLKQQQQQSHGTYELVYTTFLTTFVLFSICQKPELLDTNTSIEDSRVSKENKLKGLTYSLHEI